MGIRVPRQFGGTGVTGGDSRWKGEPAGAFRQNGEMLDGGRDTARRPRKNRESVIILLAGAENGRTCASVSPIYPVEPQKNPILLLKRGITRIAGIGTSISKL